MLFTPYEMINNRYAMVGIPKIALVQPSASLDPLLAKEVLFPELFEKVMGMMLPPGKTSAFVSLGILQCVHEDMVEWFKNNKPVEGDRLAKMESEETETFLKDFGNLLEKSDYISVEVW